MKGICKLCEKERDLKLSHIIPKFVFRWMQRTGGKYFRTLENPNIRNQDGDKTRLLCDDCEQKFSKSEKWFSDNIFYPYLETNNNVIRYNSELSRFIISVLWRTLQADNEESLKDEYIINVLEDWRLFLLNDNYAIKFSDIHLSFLPNEWGSQSQPNQYISRYFNRATDGGIIFTNNGRIVFVKFARFILFCELDKSGGNFRGTKISINSGITMPGQFIINEQISSFFINRGFSIYKLMEDKISDKQQDIINNEALSDIVKLMTTDLGKRIQDDFKAKINPSQLSSIFNYLCDCCSTSLEEPNGYLLRTFEIIRSQTYWEDTFNNNNYGIDKLGLESRVEYFKHVSSFTSPWVVCEKCIYMFNVDLKESKKIMYEWIQSRGERNPPQSDDFKKYLSEQEINNMIHNIVTIELKNKL